MATDPGALDRAQRAAWQRAAGAWGKWQASIRDATHIVSQWMVDAIDPQPGEQVLDLAAGPGETGFIAARRLGDDGGLTSTDQSEEMVSVARRRAEELELHNVRFAVLDAQRIELDPASFDAALCRFGYMLMGDPDAALRGTHRVLKPGGRVALAVWDAPDRNVWMVALPAQLVARGALPPPAPDAPTPFSMAEVSSLEQRLGKAGFGEIRTDKIEFDQAFDSFDQYWEMTCDLAAPLADALRSLDAGQTADVREAVRGSLSQFAGSDGRLAVPASAVVATATA